MTTNKVREPALCALPSGVCLCSLLGGICHEVGCGSIVLLLMMRRRERAGNGVLNSTSTHKVATVALATKYDIIPVSRFPWQDSSFSLQLASLTSQNDSLFGLFLITPEFTLYFFLPRVSIYANCTTLPSKLTHIHDGNRTVVCRARCRISTHQSLLAMEDVC
jgi:hypothetical protein